MQKRLITALRYCVCNELGLGECDGKQLLKQLNLYNFTAEELSDAMPGPGNESSKEGQNKSGLDVKVESDSVQRYNLDIDRGKPLTQEAKI